MSERIEAPEPSFDAPDTTTLDLGRRLDALDALDTPDARDATDVRVPADAEFLAWHEGEGDTGPRRYERAGDRLPWTEHPDNDHAEDYDWHPDLEREVQDTYAAHGFDGATVERINAIRAEKPTANCGECARSVASTLDGCPRSAAAIDQKLPGEDMEDMETWAGARFGAEDATDQGLDAIDRELTERGDGAQAVLAVRRRNGDGHYLNAARIDGQTMIIDAQPEGGRMLPLERGGREYLHNHKFTSVQWMPLDRSPRNV